MTGATYLAHHMPRTIRQIINQADELAARFENHEPDAKGPRNAIGLQEVRKAFLARADAERRIATSVARARIEGHSWSSIGAMLGTSGEAARQRFGKTTSIE